MTIIRNAVTKTIQVLYNKVRDRQVLFYTMAMNVDKNCLLEARREYTTLLCYNLYKPIYQGIRTYWDQSKRTAKPGSVYEEFQKKLRMVKNWNQDIIENEYKHVVEKSKCDYLQDLIRKVFILNTQILASVEQVSSDHKFKVIVPNGEKFLHRCYTECARMFYESVWLLEDRPDMVSRLDQAKHLQKAYKLIMTCIENTIRNMLPIESLMKRRSDVDDEISPQHYSYAPPNGYPQWGQGGWAQPRVSSHNEGSASSSDIPATLHMNNLGQSAYLGNMGNMGLNGHPGYLSAVPSKLNNIDSLFQTDEALGSSNEPDDKSTNDSLEVEHDGNRDALVMKLADEHDNQQKTNEQHKDDESQDNDYQDKHEYRQDDAKVDSIDDIETKPWLGLTGGSSLKLDNIPHKDFSVSREEGDVPLLQKQDYVMSGAEDDDIPEQTVGNVPPPVTPARSVSGDHDGESTLKSTITDMKNSITKEITKVIFLNNDRTYNRTRKRAQSPGSDTEVVGSKPEKSRDDRIDVPVISENVISLCDREFEIVPDDIEVVHLDQDDEDKDIPSTAHRGKDDDLDF